MHAGDEIARPSGVTAGHAVVFGGIRPWRFSTGDWGNRNIARSRSLYFLRTLIRHVSGERWIRSFCHPAVPTCESCKRPIDRRVPGAGASKRHLKSYGRVNRSSRRVGRVSSLAWREFKESGLNRAYATSSGGSIVLGDRGLSGSPFHRLMAEMQILHDGSSSPPKARRNAGPARRRPHLPHPFDIDGMRPM